LYFSHSLLFHSKHRISCLLVLAWVLKFIFKLIVIIFLQTFFAGQPIILLGSIQKLSKIFQILYLCRMRINNNFPGKKVLKLFYRANFLKHVRENASLIRFGLHSYYKFNIIHSTTFHYVWQDWLSSQDAWVEVRRSRVWFLPAPQVGAFIIIKLQARTWSTFHTNFKSVFGYALARMFPNYFSWLVNIIT
jgi:hypothetical protein